MVVEIYFTVIYTIFGKRGNPFYNTHKMNLLFIGGVVITVIVIRNRVRFKRDLKKQGGIRQRYHEVISAFLVPPPDADIFDVSVLNESIKSMTIQVRGATTNYLYSFSQQFNGFNIKFEADLGIGGEVKKDWTFPDNMNQQLMLEKIGSDMDEIITNAFANNSQ